MRQLPVQLHQLSLDENALVCDCRSLALKRWLLESGVPLSAPIRCSGQPDEARPKVADEKEKEKEAEQRRLNFLDQMELGDFVCAPSEPLRAVSLDAAPPPPQQAHLEQGASGRPAPEPSAIWAAAEWQRASRLSATRPKLSAIFQYLERTLVAPPPLPRASNESLEQTTAGLSGGGTKIRPGPAGWAPKFEIVRALEGKFARLWLTNFAQTHLGPEWSLSWRNCIAPLAHQSSNRSSARSCALALAKHNKLAR